MTPQTSRNRTINQFKGKKTLAGNHSTVVTSLAAAAALLPSTGAVNTANAQGIPENAEVRVAFDTYKDWQDDAASSNGDRYTVYAPSIWFLTPIGDSTSLQGSAVLDSVSGASPFFHDTLSAASIEDTRYAGDFTVTQYFKQISVSLGGAFSEEDDYASNAGTFGTSFWTKDKLTTYNLGGSFSYDEIASTDNPNLHENKQTASLAAGVTQIIDKNSLGQVNLTWTNSDGFLTDNYKTQDLRPDSRTMWAILFRYVRFIESQEAALHLDYRYFFDDWDVDSHTLQAAWYQPITEDLMLRLRTRYYTQSASEFYSDVFPPPETLAAGSPFSADQRLSAFGSLMGGIKAIYEFTRTFGASVSFDYFRQLDSLRLIESGSPGLEPFNAYIASIGLHKKF